MAGKRVRVDISPAQSEALHKAVFSQMQLSLQQRRNMARDLVVTLPTNGAPVDFFCEGKFVGAL